jgi:hypothetical protein
VWIRQYRWGGRLNNQRNRRFVDETQSRQFAFGHWGVFCKKFEIMTFSDMYNIGHVKAGALALPNSVSRRKVGLWGISLNVGGCVGRWVKSPNLLRNPSQKNMIRDVTFVYLSTGSQRIMKVWPSKQW